MPRTIAKDLRIAWDGTNYIDESARLVSASGTMRLVPPGESITSGGGIVDTCTLTLQNADGRYSPLLTTGALYANLQNGGAYHRPVYLRVSIDGGSNYSTIFRGVIKIPIESAPTASEAATVTIECRSVEEDALTLRTSTTRANFALYHDSGYSESDIIEAWLTAAGVDPGDMELDAGFFPVPWAWLDDESPIADAWNLAAACGGRLYTTPDGKYRYENAAHWILSPHDTSQATLTAASAGQIQPWYNDRELYNAVTVEVSERALLDTDTIWKADDVVLVPSGATITHVARFRQPVYSIGTINFTAVTSGGTDITSDVTITPTPEYYAQRVTLSIANANATQAARLVILNITGQAVSGRPGAETTSDTTAGFWSARTGRTRTIRGNVYIQTMGQASFVSAFLLDRHKAPRLFWRVREVPGDPARLLGDRLTINNGAIMSSSRDMFVTAIDWRLSNTGFGQAYEGIDATELYPYGDTTPGYFIIGTSTFHATASDHLFY